MSSSAGCSVFQELISCSTLWKRAEDFTQALEHLSDFAGADGCIIWEKFHAGNDKRRYFRLAHWFRKGCPPPPYYFLPRDTRTGDSIESQEFHIVRDVSEATLDGTLPDGESLLSRGIRAFCSIPVTFGPMREASVNLYWRGEVPPDEEIGNIRRAATVTPALMNSALDRIGFELLQTVERKLNEVNPQTAGGKITFQKVLKPVAEAFDALECTIFLEDRNTAPGVYSWRGSADEWPWKTIDRSDAYTVESKGLTPWVIKHNRTLRFVDLAHYELERDAYANNEVYKTDRPEIYQELDWPSRDGLVSEAKGYYKQEPLPPLGFVCVPILDVDRVVGALRCCLTRSAPYLFDERHIQILLLVAEQIGHWWSTHIALEAEMQETARFKRLVEGVANMHDLAFRSLSNDEQPQMKPLWDRSLELLSEITPWPDALSIRAVRNEALEYVAHRGSRWGLGSSATKRLSSTYDVDDLQWGGSRAVTEKRVISESNPGLPGRMRSLIFPDATRIVHAPILAGKKALGVIDIRGFDQREIPPHLGLVCELIGRQLGLYQNLQELFWSLRSREAELSKEKAAQDQAYEDFVHQLRNPLVKAGLLAEEADANRLPALRELRSHLRHANMFADTINYFVELAKNDRLETELSVMQYKEIVPLLEQMAADQEITKANTRRIRFSVDADSFEPLYRLTVMYSQQLLLHCMFNLLDNAAKYSRSDSVVHILARYDEGSKRFMISVSNQTSPTGHRIDRTNRDRLVERGVRGDRALMTTAGGRGIGLWIVKKFMEAMKGDLVVVPTDGRDRNVFILRFRTGMSREVKP